MDLSYFENINRPLLVQYTNIDCDEHINNLKVNILELWNNRYSKRMNEIQGLFSMSFPEKLIMYFNECIMACDTILLVANEHIIKIESSLTVFSIFYRGNNETKRK